MWTNKKILLGVSGGIAIYKTLSFISRLKKNGAMVDVILTENAAKFVTPLTFQTMARSRVHMDAFDETDPAAVQHIDLAKHADVFLVAPATANVLAKLAHGIADDLLTATALALPPETPVLLAPTMNTRMLHHPATQANIAVLKERGARIVQPASGFLACNEIGDGRMAEPDQLEEAVVQALTPQDLVGKRFVVTAGGTREKIDPVRYITNRSSGKMGWEIARNAALRGAEVTLIATTALPEVNGMRTIRVESTQEMLEEVRRTFDACDALVMAAAPSDFRVKNASDQKMKKESGAPVLQLAENPDILKTVTQNKKHQFVVAFAAETQNLLENARKKLTAKRADFIVSNDVTQRGAGFDQDTNIVTIIDAENEQSYDLRSKRDIAEKIVTRIREGIS